MKLLRTIRLDPSDTFVFEHAAAPGEWAVPGTFMFWDREPTALAGKALATFRGGLLGVESFGWSTLAQIVDATETDHCALVDRLAQQLQAQLGAPGPEPARAAAEQEVAFVMSLCDHPSDTLIAVRRAFEDGAIREAFRTLRPRGERKPMRAYSFLHVEGEEEPSESIDLAGLAQSGRDAP